MDLINWIFIYFVVGLIFTMVSLKLHLGEDTDSFRVGLLVMLWPIFLSAIFLNLLGLILIHIGRIIFKE
jgi:hypothetical protein